MPNVVDGHPRIELLAPECVSSRRWSARHESTFSGTSFAALKSDIAHTGGNLVPALVRPMLDLEAYELVYGERRLRACRELGLPLQAIAHSMSDMEAARARAAECRYSNWSPYERGTLFGRMLKTGLYPSQRRLAEDLGIPVNRMADDLRVAELPAPVLSAFEAPTQLKVAWARKLTASLKMNPSRLLASAKQFTWAESPTPASQVYAALVGLAASEK